MQTATTTCTMPGGLGFDCAGWQLGPTRSRPARSRPSHLFHQQKYLVPPRCNVLLYLLKLQRCKVLHTAAHHSKCRDEGAVHDDGWPLPHRWMLS